MRAAGSATAAADAGDGPDAKRSRAREARDVAAAASMALPLPAAGEGGEEEAVNDDEDLDDVLEMEADTPGGYHVQATLVHHHSSKDAEEVIVEATLRP